MSDTPVRINIGAGDSPIDGFDNSYDLKQGKKAFPLDLPENSVDELRCSHTLEHFACDWIPIILKDWVRCLKPGGLMKIAVPDFDVIASRYVAGEKGQFQGWTYGGQLDTNDFHFTLFDFDTLCAYLRDAGLVGLHRWGFPGEQDKDSSCLEVSLNIAGYKRPEKWPATVAAMSRPRLGFQDMFGNALDALLPLGIALVSRSGAYWSKALTNAINHAIALGAEYVLTLDYDTVIGRNDIEDLLALMAAKPDADALAPVQMGRSRDLILMNPKGNPDPRGITMDELEVTYFPVMTAHFGCTLFRVSAFKKLPQPWFYPSFKPGGEQAYDDDINFWLGFDKAGLKAFLTPRIVVGHLEVVVMWPDRRLKLLYQRTDEFNEGGKPREVWR